MHSQSYIEIIARSGGLFTNKLIDNNDSIVFSRYIKNNDIAEIISTTNKNQSGILYKIKDKLLKEHYPYNSRSSRRILTYKGYKELNERVKEHLESHNMKPIIYRHRHQEFYKNIEQELLSNNEFSNSTRYEITDYQIYKSFAKILFYFHTGILVYSTKMEKEFCTHLYDHRKITKGISYAKNYKTGKDVIFFPDYSRSEKSIIQMLQFYNDSKFEIYIFSMRPKDEFIFKMRKQMMSKGVDFINYKIINDGILNEIFGEY